MYMTLAYLGSGVTAAIGAAFLYQYRSIPGAKHYCALLAVLGLMSLAANLEYLGVTAEAKLVWRTAQQLLYACAALAGFLLTLAYNDADKLNHRRIAVLLGIVPALASTLIAAELLHGWIISAYAPPAAASRLIVEYSTIGEAVVYYGCALALGSSLYGIGRSILFVRRARRQQLMLLGAAHALPTAVILLDALSIVPLESYRTLLVILSAPACMLFLLVIYRWRLKEVAPIPRSKLFHMMSEGLVVLDSEARVLDQNDAAKLIVSGMSRLSARQLLGHPITDAIPEFQQVLRRSGFVREAMMELSYAGADGKRYITVKLTPVGSGAVLSLTDVTELRRLEREWMRKASTDGLTGIYNRAGYMERTEQVWAAANRADEPISLLLMDIDLFKNINDRFGHQTGDSAICSFVESVLRVVEKPFIFGRVGGEEFALTLPGRSKRQAYELGERIRQAVEGLVVPTTAGAGAAAGELRYTVSIGVAVRAAGDRTAFDAVYAQADRSLYKAKQNGRNQTQTA